MAIIISQIRKTMQEKSALLVIDVQRGFINKYTKDIPSLIEQEQTRYDFVWSAQLEHKENSPFLKIRRYSGFSDIDSPEELAFNLRPDAKTIFKHGYSAVTNKLSDELKANNIIQIDLMGVDTDQCVLATALALFDLGITPRIVVDRCASTGGPEAHDAGVDVLRRALGDQNMIYRSPLD